MSMPHDENDSRFAILRDGPEDFAALIRLVGLNPSRDLRHADWAGISFRDSDIRGFDFSAARLHGCDFKGARIAGACFAQAELGIVLPSRGDIRAPAVMTGIADLRAASDWQEYMTAFAPSKRWKDYPRRIDTSHLPIGSIFSDAPGASPELVVVPPGQFVMGSPEDEEGRSVNEGPPRSVTFARPFAIGRFTVAESEFQLFRNRRKSGGPSWSAMYPITHVTWHDAAAYCRWLNAKLGLPQNTYRLPSEAEWEYAARAGTDGPFWWDGPISPDKANFASNAKGTVPVDCYDPNPWGLYQVHGNVWEWCQDVYRPTLERIRSDGKANHADSKERTSGKGNDGDHLRVLRGGGWGNVPALLRAAHRNKYRPDYKGDSVGFRVVRSL